MRHLKWVFVLLLCSFSAFGGILSSSGSVTFGGGPAFCSSESLNSTGTTTASCNNGTTSGSIQAQSDYGVLKAYASFVSTNEMEQTVSSIATAFFADFLTLSSSGSPTSIDFTFTVTGAGLSGSTPWMLLSASTSSMPGPPLVISSGPGTYTLTSNWGGFLVLQASLQASAEFDNGAPGPWTGAATADFFSTATLSSITVYDGLKDISDTVSITGGAASYPLGGAAAVPEPSTLLLTAGAAAAIAIARKRVRA
jgi:hypothetical protein